MRSSQLSMSSAQGKSPQLQPSTSLKSAPCSTIGSGAPLADAGVSVTSGGVRVGESVGVGDRVRVGVAVAVAVAVGGIGVALGVRVGGCVAVGTMGAVGCAPMGVARKVCGACGAQAASMRMNSRMRGRIVTISKGNTRIVYTGVVLAWGRLGDVSVEALLEQGVGRVEFA
jgi:hypothetical protein